MGPLEVLDRVLGSMPRFDDTAHTYHVWAYEFAAVHDLRAALLCGVHPGVPCGICIDGKAVL